MKVLRIGPAIVALAAMLFAASAANSAATPYFGYNAAAGATVTDGALAGQDPKAKRDSFLSTLTSVQTEGFTGTPSGATNSLTNIFGAGSGVTLSSSGVANTTSRVQYTPGSPTATGRFNTTGDPTTAVSTAGASGWFETNKGTTTVSFTTAVSAFGAFITDVGDFRGELVVDVFSASTKLYTRTLISSGSGTVGTQGGLGFFGYTDDTSTFDRIVFTLNQQSTLPVGQYDFIGFDDLITGVLRTDGTVPEPGSLALAGLALAAAGYTARRRRA